MSNKKQYTRKQYTRKINRIPSGGTSKTISPIKTESLSPGTRKMRDVVSVLSNMDYRENPETLNLLNTNKQYKSQINHINLLQLKIQTYEDEISKFEELNDENDKNIDILHEKMYYHNTSYPQRGKMKTEIESLEKRKNKYSKEIDLREARIEETEFLTKIWQSIKINDNEKKRLEKEYTKEYRKFDNKFKSIQNEIDNSEKQTFEKTYPNIERNIFDEDRHEWIFDTDKKQKLFDDFNKNRILQSMKLSEEHKKLNDNFYRGYNKKIENIIN